MIITEEQKKQKKLKIILVVTILLIVGVLGWRFLGDGGNILPSFIPTSEYLFMDSETEEDLPIAIAKFINLDLRVLNDFRFENLKSHGDLPIKIDEAGRDNPFIPY